MENGEPSLKLIERVLRVLNSFTPNVPVLTIAEIREATGLPATTASRLVHALTAQGLLISLGQGYGLSPRFLRWADVSRLGWDLPTIAEPHLMRLRDLTGETASLQVPVTGGRLVVATAIARRSIAFQMDVGGVLPLHAGSGGKVTLAFSTEVMPKDLPAFTANTPTNRAALTRELEQIRAQGWCFACGEREDGLNSVSAPVWGVGRAYVAAITVGGPAYRLTDTVLDSVVVQVVTVAEQLSRALGFEKPNISAN